jgi:hypothetical protein
LQDAHLTRLLGGRLKVRQHARAHVDAFAHVKRNFALAIKQVDAGRVGDVVDRRFQLGRHAGAALQQASGFALQRLQPQFALRHLQPGQHHVYVAHGTVARQCV